jgi:colanic acid/amylovoran biosynthesis glycosyltransferase
LIDVVHSVPCWLPRTAQWIHRQIVCLPPTIKSQVVCEETANPHEFPGVEIFSLDASPRWRATVDELLRRLKVRRHLGLLVEVAKRHRADVIHSHFGYTGWADLGAVRRTRAKHAVTFYGGDASQIPREDARWLARYRRLFERADAVLCEGKVFAETLRRLGCPQETIRVHHLGVALSEIDFRPRRWHRGEPLRVLLAGAFREKKGLPYALEALGRLGRSLPLEVVIIGGATSEACSLKEEQKILETITRHDLGSRTRMLGFQPHQVLMRQASRCHVFLSPSVTAEDGDVEGGVPVVIIEMAASGMPVVSTTHCDIPEVIQHGRTGLTAPERDVDALIDQLRWLVEHDQAWEKMVTAARRHVETEYDATKQGKRLAEIYQALVDRTR